MNKKDKVTKGAGLVLVMAASMLAGLYWLVRLDATVTSPFADRLSRDNLGTVFGVLPRPAQPQLAAPLTDQVERAKTPKMVVKRIPLIRAGTKRPHPLWSRCDNCHLFIDGPAAGARQKSPVGAALETVSSIAKVGPPILPNANRPHPSAGRCIKCHDIVIEASQTTAT